VEGEGGGRVDACRINASLLLKAAQARPFLIVTNVHQNVTLSLRANTT